MAVTIGKAKIDKQDGVASREQLKQIDGVLDALAQANSTWATLTRAEKDDTLRILVQVMPRVLKYIRRQILLEEEARL